MGMPKIVIDTERCKGCQLCINVCPKKIIAVCDKVNKKGYFPALFIDEKKCTACAVCAKICPDVAIEVYR